MPFVTVAAVSRGSLVDSADRRWRAIGEARPDLEPALALQRQLLTLVIDLAGTLARGPLPKLSLPPRYLAAKLTRGVPVLAGEPIPVPVPILAPALLRLCEALANGGAGAAATHIRQAIESGSIEPGSLLIASLGRGQAAVRTGAVHRGLAPDLVWLVAELAVSPFAHALQRAIFAGLMQMEQATALTSWGRGYCPACGSWPALAEVVSGHRVLRCSFGAVGW